MEIAIITIGNEVLKGHTSNSNYTFLSRQLTLLGNHVRRGYTVSDNFEEIDYALKESLKVSDLVVTTGGLGPTYDDITIASIASALGIRLIMDDRSLAMIRERLASKGFPLTEERKKMALIPEGSEPLFNAVGSAPGVLIKYSGRLILSLPGVPSEMEGIFRSVRERFKNPDIFYYEESQIFPNVTEGELAPLIRSEMKQKGDSIYIKSHPESIPDGGFRVNLEISCYGKDEYTARSSVRDELELFRKKFLKL